MDLTGYSIIGRLLPNNLSENEPSARILHPKQQDMYLKQIT